MIFHLFLRPGSSAYDAATGANLGRRFMEEIERACRELGLRYVFLLTDDS